MATKPVKIMPRLQNCSIIDPAKSSDGKTMILTTIGGLEKCHYLIHLQQQLAV